jgi:hypothetical protein
MSGRHQRDWLCMHEDMQATSEGTSQLGARLLVVMLTANFEASLVNLLADALNFVLPDP